MAEINQQPEENKPQSGYERRKAERVARYLARAEKARDESEARYKQARYMIQGMAGTPILIGHHSEKRHRRDLEKIDNNLRKSCEADKAAKHYERRAEAAESRSAIDSDDPDAPSKLRERIDELKRKQEFYKAANKAIRSHKGDAAKVAESLDISAAVAAGFCEPDFCGRVGFPSYVLQNNLANIKRLERRLEQLAACQSVSGEYQFGACRVIVDSDDGRVRIETPGRNEEATRLLRSRGFCWSRLHVAWSRKLTASAVVVAKQVGEQLAKIYE